MSGPDLAPGAEGEDALGTGGKLTALLDAGESVLAEREADMKEMERNIRVLGNLPFDSPKSLNGSHTDDERKKNE